MADTAPTRRLVLVCRGSLKGHGGWITKIAVSNLRDDFVITASRDKTICTWNINSQDDQVVGTPIRFLEGHNHFVSDCALSKDGRYLLSSSWDGTLKLWNLDTYACKSRFIGHTGDVLGVSFSSDNRQIFSVSRDKTIRLWNILGVCKFAFKGPKACHDSWVTSLALSPNVKLSYMATGGADKTVRLWDFSQGKCLAVHHGHENIVNSVHISESGLLLASGGKDGRVNIWSNEKFSYVGSINLVDEVSCVKFNPKSSYLAVSSGQKIYIYDVSIVQESTFPLIMETNEESLGQYPVSSHSKCTTLTWGYDGRTLYVGYTDNLVRIFKIEETQI